MDIVLDELAAGRLELGRDGETAHLRILCDGHWETHPFPSGSVARYLRLAALRLLDVAPPAGTIDTAMATLAALAIAEGVERPTGVRIAAAEGKVYLDLCDSTWRVGEVDAAGWRIAEDVPVAFLRRPSLARRRQATCQRLPMQGRVPIRRSEAASVSRCG